MPIGIITVLTTFRILLVPAQFQNMEFIGSAEDLQEKISAVQNYYNREFCGVNDIEEFVFDIAPIVTLSQNCDFYGANYSTKKDAQIYLGLREACVLSNNNIDFTLYDSFGTGNVDVVCVVTPGESEIESKNENSIYPQYLSLKDYSSSLNLDGKNIDKFVITTELSSYGVLCHELAHHFSLPDFYDTDYEASGGNAQSLGLISLMDEGCKIIENIPSLTAIEIEMLGIGNCDTLKVGKYSLSPIRDSRNFLRTIGPNPNEYYLLDCDNELNLRVFYVDKSENDRGYSDRLRKNLSAAERWEYNEVNTRPGMECAKFQGDNYSFSYFDSTSSSLSLKNIKKGDADISFDVIQAMVLSELNLFQDSAVIRWKVDESFTDIDNFELSYSDNSDTTSVLIPCDRRYYIIENLEPNTKYNFTIKMRLRSHQSFSINRKFTTKQHNKGTKPYIYLSQSDRKANGAFNFGSKLLLRIFNGYKIARTDWYFNNRTVRPDPDGYFIVREQGTLKAVILYEDGNTETIIKEIKL